MEPAAHKVFLQFQSFLEAFDRMLDVFKMLLAMFFDVILSLALVSQSFRVPDLGVLRSQTNCLIIVSVSLIYFLERRDPVEISVTSIKVNC